MISTEEECQRISDRRIYEAEGEEQERRIWRQCLLFLSTEEELLTEEDIKHVVEAVAPVAVVCRISIPLKVLSLTAMDVKNTKESHALYVTKMGTL